MSQFIRTQTVAGGGSNFNGSAGAGLFLFDMPNLPRDQSVQCLALGIFSAGTGTWIMAYWLPPVGSVGDRILAGSVSGASLIGPDGNLATKFCPGSAPRAADGRFWSLAVYSAGLSASTTATLSYGVA